MLSGYGLLYVATRHRCSDRVTGLPKCKKPHTWLRRKTAQEIERLILGTSDLRDRMAFAAVYAGAKVNGTVRRTFSSTFRR